MPERLHACVTSDNWQTQARGCSFLARMPRASSQVIGPSSFIRPNCVGLWRQHQPQSIRRFSSSRSKGVGLPRHNRPSESR